MEKGVCKMARIDEYQFGRIVVDGRERTKDLIILPERIVDNWWRAGAYGRLNPDPGLLRDLKERGLNVEVLETGAAVDRYRESNPAATAAALHLTC
jgi:hypothetical protein